MTLSQLEYFRALAHSQQLNETANQMYVSASTISTSIRNLEEELGVSLFERPGRTIRLNEQGRIFLTYTEKIFDLLEEGKHKVEISMRRCTESITVAIPSSLKMGNIFGKYLLSNPAVEVTTRNYTCIQEEVDIADKSDFFVTVEDLRRSPSLEYQCLLCVPVRLIVHKENPLALKEICCLDDLRDQTFLFRPENDCFQQQINVVLKEHGFRPKRIHVFDDAICSKMVKKDIGISISFDRQKTFSRHSECPLTTVKIKEFEESEKGTFVLRGYWNKSKGLTKAASDFLNLFCYALRNYYLEENSVPLKYRELMGDCTEQKNSLQTD